MGDFDQNFTHPDDAFQEADVSGGHIVHIRVQQRNGRKNWTIVEGLPVKMLGYPVNFDKILKALKKSFKTNGAIQGSTEGSSVIQLQGDFRRETRDWMVANGLAEEKGVVVHGT
mmetsp:Transcript_58767/g.135537  ORF Transcript_58767/g.135537 Transcript_58767/m.135537 type:complete len:114 (-) Transcript_58767:169-510(-)